MKMRLVSLLTSYHIYKGDGYSNEQAEAQKLLKECEADPSSSEICHKIGKYYNTYKVCACATMSLSYLAIIYRCRISNDLLFNRMSASIALRHYNGLRRP